MVDAVAENAGVDVDIDAVVESVTDEEIGAEDEKVDKDEGAVCTANEIPVGDSKASALLGRVETPQACSMTVGGFEVTTTTPPEPACAGVDAAAAAATGSELSHPISIPVPVSAPLNPTPDSEAAHPQSPTPELHSHSHSQSPSSSP